jgi:hypothetical protein
MDLPARASSVGAVNISRFVAVATCASILLGCGSPKGTVIDGWPIGANVPDCAGRTFTPSCDQLIAAAEAALDARDGRHAAIVDVHLYYEANPPIREGGNTVAVFVLGDGSRRAILSGWSPGGSLTLEYGP